jgi:hypothetical protein
LSIEPFESPQVYNCPEIEITPAMLAAGAMPLYQDETLNLGFSSAEYYAAKVLECALAAWRGETSPHQCED